jgi:ribosomal protein S11
LESYQLRHHELLDKLKKRRDGIPAAMAEYYYFINRIVDIHTTDNDELVTVSDAPGKAMRIAVDKLNKDGQQKASSWT